MDTDFHYIRDAEDLSLSKKDDKIQIGKNNWIASDCRIYKGFKSCDYVICGSGSKCRGHIDEPYTLWVNKSKLEKVKSNCYRDLSLDPDLISSLT